MSAIERTIVLWAIGYMAIYAPMFVAFASGSLGNQERLFFVIMPFHVLGMIQNLVALVITIRDLFLRQFPQANQKSVWILLILSTGGIGWLIYVFRHALRPRPRISPT